MRDMAVNAYKVPFYKVDYNYNGLIKKNKEQREKLAANETKISELLTFKRQAFDENQALVKENDDLKKRIKELETELNNKSDKLENLNAQVAQTDDLAKLLADAKSLLDE